MIRSLWISNSLWNRDGGKYFLMAGIGDGNGRNIGEWDRDWRNILCIFPTSLTSLKTTQLISLFFFLLVYSYGYFKYFDYAFWFSYIFFRNTVFNNMIYNFLNINIMVQLIKICLVSTLFTRKIFYSNCDYFKKMYI